MEAQAVPYIDIQHDALSVCNDVEQGIVVAEDIWVSAYQSGKRSVHGKVKVSVTEAGGSELVARDGVQVERTSKATFAVSVPCLGLDDIPVRFPRQVIDPPYKKEPLKAPLYINAIDYSPIPSDIVVAGPDGYLVVLPSRPDYNSDKKLELVGHVGDVQDAKWFPSGEVILSCGSDLSIRVWGAKDGINPRTLKGHTRAVTTLGIVGVGKKVVSGSLDGSIRVWEIGPGKEVWKWETKGKGGVQQIVILDGEEDALDPDGWSVLSASAHGLEVFVGSTVTAKRHADFGVESKLVSMAYDPASKVIATGHADGTITLRHLGSLESILRFKRNEASVYSLHFIQGDLCVGTAAGLPARLSISKETSGGFKVGLREEYAGWEAVGVETWVEGKDGSVWVAGGLGGIRRY